MSVARGLLLVLGVATCAIAFKCLMYNVGSMNADFSGFKGGPFDAPYFDKAFHLMSYTCIAFYLALAFIGIQFIRGRTGVWPFLMYLLIAELFYQQSIALMWMSSEYGMSIAAATGVANGGMMYQIQWWFPIWAPVIAFVASRHLEKARAPASPIPTSS